MTAGTAWFLAEPPELRAALLHAARAVRQSPPQFQVLTPEQAADLDAIAARIIPTDETPGAREAGAIHFIDRSLATFAKDVRPVVEEGLADLNRRVAERWPGSKRFSELSAEQQDALLRAIEQTQFFGQIRFGVIVGTFGNPSWGGNREQIGWTLIGHEMRPAFQPPFGWYDAEATRGGGP